MNSVHFIIVFLFLIFSIALSILLYVLFPSDKKLIVATDFTKMHSILLSVTLIN